MHKTEPVASCVVISVIVRKQCFNIFASTLLDIGLDLHARKLNLMVGSFRQVGVITP